jgi:hypothetical protein
MAAASPEDRTSDRAVTLALALLAIISGIELVHVLLVRGRFGFEGSLATLGLLVALSALVSETREAIHGFLIKRS